MFKYIFSFLWPENGTDLSLEEAYNVLHSAREEPEEHLANKEIVNFDSEYVCFYKTGVITSVKNDYYTIDNKYEFQSHLRNLEVGMQVSFTIFDVKGEIKVTNLAVLDDWSTTPCKTVSSWCVRNFICKVAERQGRAIVVTPSDIRIDLNEVASEFIPILGDWLDIEAKVQLDENVTDLFGQILEVQKIRPLRPRILQGRIKEWCTKTRTGCIDRVVYFDQEALSAGYIPVVGDKVITEVIESDQGRFTCRALKIISEEQKCLNATSSDSTTFDFVKENNAVYVSDDISINSKRIGETIEFTFEVTNKSTELLLLISVTFESNTRQCNFQKSETLTNVQLTPSESVRFKGLCTIKNVGVTKELVLFTFTNFKVGRWITVSLEVPRTSFDKARNADGGSLLLGNTRFKNDRSVIKGQRVVAPPRFISARLPEYPLPQRLLNLFLKYKNCNKSNFELLEELRSVKPCLNLTLSFNIYEDRFHTLLYFEEIYQILAIRTYNSDLTCFIKNDEYLMLEIENLSERRPSLMVGDRIIAKDPYDDDAFEYEGYIHKIGAKHIYIKFAALYHESYNGEDVSIMAVGSRSSFRRMHQAVGLAVRNLAHSFLFPSKVESKRAQVTFSYDEYSVCLKESEKAHDGDNEVKNTTCQATDEEQKKEVKSQLLLEAPDMPKNKRQYRPNFIARPQTNLKLEWYNKSLNYYQKEAVRNILIGEARPLPYIIFGPPGTGKTVTLVETILQILKLLPHARLLVAAPSNSAADLIAIRLIDSGILKPGDLIRLVAFRCVADDMLPLKLIPYCATADIAKEGTTEQFFNSSDRGLTLGCSSSVIGRHRVTVGTCSALGVLFNMGFSKGHFTHIVVDEAGQTTEPEILIPLVFLDVFTGQVILAGDPMQLGPVVSSAEAASFGLDETFLDRMLNRFPYVRDIQGFPQTGGYDPRLVTRLVYNYRSLPEVLKLTSDLFYNGELIPTISSVDSEEANLLQQVQEILPCRKSLSPPAIVFHGVLGENYQTADCPSWFNPSEASQIFYYVNELYRLGIKSTDIGIISPYIKQVRQIRAILVEAEFEIPKVGTVEEFQGQEFPVILLSTVRSNESLVVHDLTYKLGFLSLPRRVNVAISRAKALLIIVGNPQLLYTDIHWRSVLKYCVENESYCGCALPNIK